MLELVALMLAVIVVLNVGVTWRIFRDNWSSPSQRIAQAVIVWLLPFVGALVVLHLQRKQPERGSGQYPANPDAGDDFGVSTRSFRRTEESSSSHSLDSASHE